MCWNWARYRPCGIDWQQNGNTSKYKHVRSKVFAEEQKKTACWCQTKTCLSNHASLLLLYRRRPRLNVTHLVWSWSDTGQNVLVKYLFLKNSIGSNTTLAKGKVSSTSGTSSLMRDETESDSDFTVSVTALKAIFFRARGVTNRLTVQDPFPS